MRLDGLMYVGKYARDFGWGNNNIKAGILEFQWEQIAV
jgi:hypothetical protein